MFLGFLLRRMSYRTLGSMFTYDVAVTKGHSLIKSGPYSVVRHPGYSAVLAVLASETYLLLFAAGNYVDSCGIMGTPARWGIWWWYSGCVLSLMSLVRRSKVEDEMMRKQFGDEWITYSRQVRYRLLPFVF